MWHHRVTQSWRAIGATLLIAGVSFAAGERERERVALGPYLNGQLPAKASVQTGSWAVVEAFPNLEVDDPTTLVPEPGTNRLFVATRQGKVFAFENTPAVSEKTEILDLTDVTQGWDDCGLFALAFHPEYGRASSPRRGDFYVWYHYSPAPTAGPRRPSVDTPGYNRLSRFTVAQGAAAADRASEQVLINQFDENLWHDGSGMFFGTDGFLYLGVSDEGDAYDSFHNSQTLSGMLFSGALRIDVDCDPARSHPIRRQPRQETTLPEGFTENNFTANYFIPNDNPFLDPAGGVLEEFWAIGLRNPHRMTFDAPTGRIWAGDVGQDKWEEVDVVERGGNYQWAYLEGTHPSIDHGVPLTKPPAELLLGVEKPPVYEYFHGTEGKCVIGGYVYRGQRFAKELTGKYIFGDNGSGRIWALSWDGEHAATVEYLCHALPGTGYRGLSSFGVGHDGELYLCKMGRPAKIYTLQRASENSQTESITFAAPERLSWLGAFADMASLTPVAGFEPYDVNAPLWSDGALKQRWIAVPRGEAIHYAPRGEWAFPDGTVFMKHFDMVVDEVTGRRRRLETRLLVRQQGGGVYGVSYRWRRDHREADLVSAPQTDVISVTTADGVREQSWYYPSPMDCLVCHTSNAGDVLGVNARQLNRHTAAAAGGASENQLRAFSRLGLFDVSLDDATLTEAPALAAVDDTSATLEARARSYLDANCAQCHRPNGAAGYFDARFDTPLAEQGLIDGRLAKQLGGDDVRVVCPGDAARSALYQRMCLAGELRMPPLARNSVDTEAAEVVKSWINNLPPHSPAAVAR